MVITKFKVIQHIITGLEHGGNDPILDTTLNREWIRMCTDVVMTKFKDLHKIMYGLERVRRCSSHN